MYHIYQSYRQKVIIREQRRRVIRYLMDDTDQAIAVVQNHLKDTFQ